MERYSLAKYDVITIGDAMRDIFIFPSLEEMEKPVEKEEISSPSTGFSISSREGNIKISLIASPIVITLYVANEYLSTNFTIYVSSRIRVYSPALARRDRYIKFVG